MAVDLQEIGNIVVSSVRENIKQENVWSEGTLYNSIEAHIMADSIDISSADYGIFIHEGTKHIEAKPFLFVREQDMALIETKLIEYIHEMFD